MHRLKRTHQAPFEFRGWLFYDSSSKYASKYASSQSRKTLEGYVRLYITDLNGVVLECVKLDKKNNVHQVNLCESLEDAFDILATQPLTIVSSQLYNDVLRDVQVLAEV
jgi:hypothetical protein